ncbi:hypothetical protein DAMNIGENAA_32720 [Desulforhabdus amnigena]|uniref:Uncharacterized protein n=1 Tax=Desulforhabdus amnigena TaxID=40218 RepID=A0A9W6FVT6_9BACT|nr:hypothetical protein DAMNIGENAA_32720 [Desulforhabdus amnigena]
MASSHKVSRGRKKDLRVAVEGDLYPPRPTLPGIFFAGRFPPLEVEELRPAEAFWVFLGVAEEDMATAGCDYLFEMVWFMIL